MKDNPYNFTPPNRGISLEEAGEYILEGIGQCALPGDTYDTVKAISWLEFCVTCFIDEPYGKELAHECKRFIDQIASGNIEKVSFDGDFADHSGTTLREMNERAASLLSAGSAKEAYKVTASAVERASKFMEAWDEDAETFSFENAVHFVIYVASHSTANGVVWRDPQIERAFVMHACVLYELGEYSGATKFFETALSLDPVSSNVLLELAECAKRLGDADLVAHYAQEALKWAWTMKDIAKAHRSVGYALLENNHLRWATARYIVSQDYDDEPMAARELKYIEDRWGYDTSEMDLEEALRVSRAEVDGYPVSIAVRVALKTILESDNEYQSPEATEQLLMEVAKWSRSFRHDLVLLS